MPASLIADTQSILTGHHGLDKGFDGGKLIKGRKRHIIVDVMGLLLAVMVHSAGIQERRGFKLLSFKIRHLFPNLKVIWVDGGYDGQPLQLWVKRWFNWIVETMFVPSIERKKDSKIARISAFIYGLVCYGVFFVTFLYAVGFVGNFVVPHSIDSVAKIPLTIALLLNLR